jgi:hypothetical protein
MKTIELTGIALDWAVAKCEGSAYHGPAWTKYSTDWAQGGPIIEREDICINRDDSSREWSAHRVGDEFGAYWGPTPLIAAMRAYVSSKLGKHVAVPLELVA